jgi:hypothetical protein
MRTPVVAGLLLACLAQGGFAQPKYGVKADVDRKTDFAALRTYTWSTRYSAPDKEVDAHVVAAIDRELAGLGLQKLASGRADLLVVYDAQRRTDVDVDGKASKTGERPAYSVGTLLLRLIDPASGRTVFRARLDRPLSAERGKVFGEIDAAVAEIFARYPARRH